MDWAVRSARKKTRFLQGGSRSIVESLNKLNEVVTEGQDAITSACIVSSKWLEEEMKKFREAYPKKATTNSPEKSKLDEKIVLEESTPRKLEATDNNESPKASPQGSPQVSPHISSQVSPRVSPRAGPQASPQVSQHMSSGATAEGSLEESIQSTPKSTFAERSAKKPENPTHNKKQDDETQSTLNIGGKSSATKSSPWSPYKSNKNNILPNFVEVPMAATKNVTKNKVEKDSVFRRLNASQRRFVENSPPSALEQSARNPSTEASKPYEEVRGEKQALRDRTQRRSNMFVPLPDKDPLVLHAASIPRQKKGSLDFTPNNNEIAPTSNNNTKTLNFTVDSTTAVNKTPKPPLSNVFDRLSSKSTKSFENKASSRSPTRDLKRQRPHHFTYREGTGSPKERKSPQTEHTNRSIQETLKSIFDSQIPKLSQDNLGSDHNIGASASQITGRVKTRNSLIPKLSGHTVVSPISANKRLSSQKYNEPLFTLDRSPSNRSKSTASTKVDARRSGVPEEFPVGTKGSLVHTNKSNKSSVNERSLNNGTSSQKLSTTNIEENSAKDEKKQIAAGLCGEDLDSSRKGNIMRMKITQDRLTKFQLPPLAVSEKQDVKKKLDKRLSEVMRNQKEQQRRHQEKLKRKSNLEEDLRQRKSRILQESEAQKIIKSIHPVFDIAEKEANIRSRNTVLYDLNSTDHRQIIGGGQDETYGGDTTLPDIDSDSDAEDRSILAPWAQAPFLQEQLLVQQKWDPEKIFGPIPPLHTDEIFQTSRLSRLKSRQSLSRTMQVTHSEPTRK